MFLSLVFSCLKSVFFFRFGHPFFYFEFASKKRLKRRHPSKPTYQPDEITSPSTLSDVTDPAAELTMHDGTVRDLCFIEDMSNKSSLLVSGGAGDCKIYVTDCATGVPFQALAGHTGQWWWWWGTGMWTGSEDFSDQYEMDIAVVERVASGHT